jgi:glutathione-specific gamma-glutamylcyclotransferase
MIGGMPPDPPLALTREYLLDDVVRDRLRALDPDMKMISDAARAASIAGLLGLRIERNGVWIFAYGSLIWNPLFEYVERRVGKVHCNHRRFCLWTRLGRGTPEIPGLTLGLDRGGSCRGVVYRIAEEAIESELNLIWRREMFTDAYDPQWVKVVTKQGQVDAIAFTINRDHPRYARIEEDRIVETIATARGQIGACATYLFNTVEHLEQLGIRDPGLERICKRVRERQRSLSVEPS